MNKYLVEAQALARMGQFVEAGERCRKSISLGKDLVVAKRILAACLYDQGTMLATAGGLFDEAEQCFRQALAAKPDHVDALSNLGVILHTHKNRPDEAIVLYRKALALDPSSVRIAENLAKAEYQAGEFDACSATLLKLARRNPSEAAGYLIREALLVRKVVPDDAYPLQIRASIASKLDALESGDARMASPLRFPSTYFPLSYHGIGNKEMNSRLANIHLKAAPSLSWTAPFIANWKGPGTRIRLGLASAFFHAHSIGNTSRGLVERLDRSRFEVILVRLGASPRDAMADAIDASADRVVTVPADDLQAARETIASLELDLLFYQDIGMEPLGYLLSFARLAPVQCTSFGHPDTAGVPNLDYFISSDFYEVENAQDDYAERLVMIPGAGTLSYYHRPPAVKPGDRAAFGFGGEDRLYLCPQTLFKIQPVMDRIFGQILERDANARIVLIDPAREDLRPALERRLRGVLGDRMDRVSFIQSLAYLDYLRLVSCADVILDTIHFNGQNTNLEAFHLGVPVVTLPGRMQRERHTCGIYRAMGFMDLVADSVEDYVGLALRLANDTEFRGRCSERILRENAVLFENEAFVRQVETALGTMLGERLAEKSAGHRDGAA
ncbi:O-linked N-acetylglucosamine transferase, SPINDLY family protein [Noviherbaspirillum galbum]|uniref:protein O-GlcNAc transferase n=1 Tax=Noviherbaspirillum galbum TaxID=2709383 RepID=A0A6B3SFT9_9BURK|nr:tetratricopeptide repeat protein [Noviherbaspirillum galbum]NEX59724.1 tetratricopeptide repeat protein [Noviherbaspirillum galbum]